MRSYLVISGTIFGFLALLHLARIFLHWPVVIGSLTLPQAASFVGLALAGTLAIWAVRLIRRHPPGP
jgi:uncharacterized membrane protein